jgi:hypothetical protein
MLSLENKIEFLEQYLEIKNDSYNDQMKEEIYFHLFENRNEFEFLNKLKSKEEIENKIDFLISKMIMHEHEEGLEIIIDNYI